jgi:hypothetical protein
LLGVRIKVLADLARAHLGNDGHVFVVARDKVELWHFLLVVVCATSANATLIFIAFTWISATTRSDSSVVISLAVAVSFSAT